MAGARVDYETLANLAAANKGDSMPFLERENIDEAAVQRFALMGLAARSAMGDSAELLAFHLVLGGLHIGYQLATARQLEESTGL